MCRVFAAKAALDEAVNVLVGRPLYEFNVFLQKFCN